MGEPVEMSFYIDVFTIIALVLRSLLSFLWP
jgi:hypothetical protein